VTTPDIPDKFYFKIGEVSRILGVKPYVLRFWESEFRIAPSKNNSQHRVYRRQDVETLIEIKRLLYEERFTIEGAREKLKIRTKNRQQQLPMELAENRFKKELKKIKKDIVKIHEMLQ
jgi:DNA-binding transcriptional MerR regulator